MNAKTVPPTSQLMKQDSHEGRFPNSRVLSNTELVPENGALVTVVTLPASEETQESKVLVTAKTEPEAIRYDPHEISAHYQRRPLQVLGRIITVLTSTLTFALGLWWDSKRGV